MATTDNENQESCDEALSKEQLLDIPSFFDVVKAGMLMPVQAYVDQVGLDVLHSRDELGHTPAHWAALGGHMAILRYFLDMKLSLDEPSDNELAQHPIHWACSKGHIAVVDLLLSINVDIDVTDNKGCTPLIVASQYGKTMLAAFLMGKGARLQVTDKDGDTALHWAAFKGHSDLVRLLVYSGFNPHQLDNYRQGPIHLACINGSLTTVKELIEQDSVDFESADKNGKTPFTLASGRKHEDVVQYLKKRAKQKTSLIPKIDIWSIVFGPPGNSKGALMFFVLNVLFWGYPMYLIKCLPATWYDLEELHIIFMLLNVLMWVCLYHASTIDPGFLPRNIPEYDRAIKETAHFEEWKQGTNPLSQLCHTCRTVKPIRSKHCRVCNRCVKQFDHHCPYIYNCVGFNNRHWFIGFVSCVWFTMLLSFYFSYHVLLINGLDWLVVLGLIEISFFAVIASLVFFCTLYHIVVNLTTNERINYKRYDYLKNGVGKFHNPYDRGVVHNMLEFLHIRRAKPEDQVNFLGITVV